VVLISGETHGSERPIQGPVALDLLPVREIPNQQNWGQRMHPFGETGCSGAVRARGGRVWDENKVIRWLWHSWHEHPDVEELEIWRILFLTHYF
jgi:hypothetical protein